ncbi:MAG: hypothetical protein CMJ32_08680 [Phycisphaerae bacterium]|nr:hypothetical protein [Phycisphaerae bacterium]
MQTPGQTDQTSREPSPGQSSNGPAAIVILGAGAFLTILVVAYLCTWTGGGISSTFIPAVFALAQGIPPALLWMLMAFGFGWPLRAALVKHENLTMSLTMQLGMGVGLGMFMDLLLGSVGVLTAGKGVFAWLLLVVGCMMAIISVRRLTRPRLGGGSIDPLALVSVPAIAVLLVAAASAPGWLWQSEFAGYDALSYHLQLPAEWFLNGAITPLQHNVYSHLPSGVEATSLHLAVLVQDPIQSSTAVQCLQAMMVIATGWTVVAVAQRAGLANIAVVAGILLVSTPWVVIVGSMAYTGMPVLLMLACCLLVLVGPELLRERPVKTGAAIGILCGGAVLAKATALGMVMLPLILLMVLWSRRPVVAMVSLLAAAGCGLAMISPWLIGNLLVTGNPVFPFLAGVFGSGHWDQTQVDAWEAGHSATAGLGMRIRSLWDQWFIYGIGTQSGPAHPLAAQWSFIPVITIAGIVAGLCEARTRRLAMVLGLTLLVQVAFWMFFTHLQSRFLLPTAVVGSLAGTCLVASIFRNGPGQVGRLLVGFILLAGCLVPGWILMVAGAPPMNIGAAAQMAGGTPLLSTRLYRQKYLQEGEPDVMRREFMKHPITALNIVWPEESVYAIGMATPYYYTNRLEYRTVWDRGILSEAMSQSPDDPEAWVQALRDHGHQLLLVMPSELERWRTSGWLDPNLTVQRLDLLLEGLPVRMRFSDGSILLDLPSRDTAGSPPPTAG